MAKIGVMPKVMRKVFFMLTLRQRVYDFWSWVSKQMVKEKCRLSQRVWEKSSLSYLVQYFGNLKSNGYRSPITFDLMGQSPVSLGLVCTKVGQRATAVGNVI